jgi:hypothetical protein
MDERACADWSVELLDFAGRVSRTNSTGEAEEIFQELRSDHISGVESSHVRLCMYSLALSRLEPLEERLHARMAFSERNFFVSTYFRELRRTGCR